MNRLPISVALLLVLGSTTHAESLKSMILKNDALSKKALMAKDMAAFKKSMQPYITADFKYIEAGRTMNFDQMLAGMKQGTGSLQKITDVVSKLIKLNEKEDKATAEMTRSMTGTVPGPDKKMHKLTMSGKTVETYVKQGGKWKLAIMDWKSSEMIMDGKKMDPSQMGGQ
jgi:hypothetical protein